MSKFLVTFAILAACAVYVCAYPSAEASASASAQVAAETDLTGSADTAANNGDSDLKGSETFGFGYYPRYYPNYYGGYGGYGGGYGGWGSYGWGYHRRPIYPIWG